MHQISHHVVKGCTRSSTQKETAMPIPEPHRSRRRLLPTRNPLAFIAITAICAALIVVNGALLATPAGADPNPGGGNTNPFGGLSCGCAQTTPADSPALRQQIIGGIQQGLSAGHWEPNLASSPAKPPP
ncbi:hypothetical protein A5621_13565 [Mycobacterium colombiense]|uniref:Uncharacterized protein n=1 Tax=Mycobacterium colombiense TaxID=339268 RepID=A0A853M095_9MYCO|nr:hypothetical protein A9W93_25985 [Mycobacterium colombiense]OBJ16302.1 hypothetical protein A5623_18645 [Mycobacterium colombiense]OBJ38381.1 hypothetical protein A5621_13565 [Mycobacterium colombiense]OBJ58872.1 hypothetical protein A5628_00805 [Mycobacterium colombiense]